MIQFTLSLYALFRTRRAELRSHIDVKNIEELRAETSKEKECAKLKQQSSTYNMHLDSEIVEPEGNDKYLTMLNLAGELYLHVVLGIALAYQIGYYRIDTVLMLPLVEIIIATERFYPTIQLRCEVTQTNCPGIVIWSACAYDARGTTDLLINLPCADARLQPKTRMGIQI
jgi:hypothetical protein